MLQGVYVTPALLRAYDGKPIQKDTTLFVAWQSAMVDERPWMLAGSLTGYPDNAWGKVWPQDNYRLQPVEGQFNTFSIYEILPQIIELWGLNVEQQVESKKNIIRQSGK